MSISTFSVFSQVMLIDGIVLLSIDFWFTLSIVVAWRVSIDASLVDLRIVRESADSFFEGPRNLLFIVVPSTKISNGDQSSPATAPNLISLKLP
ncbi:hypothetical protein YC2023_098553 [Brassica napus]